MDNYLIDREALEQIVDELMKQKPLPANSAEELYAIREKAIKDLDDKIGMAVFCSLSEEELAEFNRLIDNNEISAEAYQKIFNDAGVDLQKIMAETISDFKNEFLGGKNA